MGPAMKELSPLNHMLAVLRERDIPLTRDDVKWAFQSPQTNTEVNSWVHQYLGPDTLLSKEEVELYARYPTSRFYRAHVFTYSRNSILGTQS
jgi:hypothetical protein